jgi:threonine/homoserine/homoserine lactone efflux protein
MEVIFNGVISGVVLAFLVGPVFFTILQTSMERGFACGAFVAIGVSLSDAFYITLTYLGVYQLFDKGNFREYLGYFGGIVLVMFGVYYLFVKSKRLYKPDPAQVRINNPWRLVGKGFIINGLSPMVLIFWLGTVGVATTKLGYSTPGKAIPFFAAIVSTVFVTDLIKAKLADRLRLILTPRFIRNLNIALGIVLLAFGCRLIYYAESLPGL